MSVAIWRSFYGLNDCMWQGEVHSCSLIQFQRGDTDTAAANISSKSSEVVSIQIPLQGSRSE